MSTEFVRQIGVLSNFEAVDHTWLVTILISPMVDWVKLIFNLILPIAWLDHSNTHNQNYCLLVDPTDLWGVSLYLQLSTFQLLIGSHDSFDSRHSPLTQIKWIETYRQACVAPEAYFCCKHARGILHPFYCRTLYVHQWQNNSGIIMIKIESIRLLQVMTGSEK